MFVGHLGAALAAKTVEPRVPLGAYVAGGFGLDLLWPVFLLSGLETARVDPAASAFTPLRFVSYPWSHSLLMSVVWGGLAGLMTWRLAGHRRAALLVGLVVVSHWLLDCLTHVPDLPLWPGGPMAGLGLWNSIPGTFAVEGLMSGAAAAIYSRALPARDRAGRWAFWLLVATVGAIWASGPLSPPPPSIGAVIVVNLVLAPILLAWAAWIDRHRDPAGLWRGRVT
jgi:hypothetical protein